MFLSLRKLTWVLLVALTGATAAHAGSWIGNGCKLWNENPESNETAQWSGNCAGGYASGYGTAQWVQDGKPGSRYTGEMAKGKFQGAGVFEGRDGTRYEGDWEDGALVRSVTAAERAKEEAAKKAAAEAQEKIAALKKKNDKCRKPKFFVCTSADETMSVCCGQDQGCKNIGNSLVSCFGGDGISDHFSPSEQTGKNQPEVVYEENKDAIRRKEELDKQEADSLARADAARIKQEKALALAVEEQRKKEAAQREEQTRQEAEKEKQRIQAQQLLEDEKNIQALPPIQPSAISPMPVSHKTYQSLDDDVAATTQDKPTWGSWLNKKWDDAKGKYDDAKERAAKAAREQMGKCGNTSDSSEALSDQVFCGANWNGLPVMFIGPYVAAGKAGDALIKQINSALGLAEAK